MCMHMLISMKNKQSNIIEIESRNNCKRNVTIVMKKVLHQLWWQKKSNQNTMFCWMITKIEGWHTSPLINDYNQYIKNNMAKSSAIETEVEAIISSAQQLECLKSDFWVVFPLLILWLIFVLFNCFWCLCLFCFHSISTNPFHLQNVFFHVVCFCFIYLCVWWLCRVSCWGIWDWLFINGWLCSV